MSTLSFDNLVFAGGGNRCFWQAGFWTTIEHELETAPKEVVSVSAGAAMSCALFSGSFDQIFKLTKDVMLHNHSNRYWQNLFTKEPVHPHATLYRKIVMDSLDADHLDQLKNGPNNRILVAHIPRWLGPRSSVLVGLGCYQLEKKLFQPVHPRMGRCLGFRSEFISVRECTDVHELADVLISSSCTPPFTPLMYRDARPILDGGMVDNVPVHGTQGLPGKTLVLLSRPYRSLPQTDTCLYVQPSRPVPVKSWDYTDPEGLQKTFELGINDGQAFLKQMI